MYSVGKLHINPATGEINDEVGGSVRLGPVNMKVLAALMDRAGEVVSRNELFEQVWKNQVVSDDALTRCVSDIRSQLEALSGESKYIETVPKRGYRWVYPPNQTDSVDSTLSPKDTATKPNAGRWSSFLFHLGWRHWLTITVIYGVVLFTLASLIVWGFGYFARPGAARVAIFATEASRGGLSDLAIDFNNQLTAALVAVDDIEVLSQRAVTLGRDNPFPYFYYEFGTQWVVESQLSGDGKQLRLTISLVDARSATVMFLSTMEFDSATTDWQAAIEQFLAQLQLQLPQRQ